MRGVPGLVAAILLISMLPACSATSKPEASPGHGESLLSGTIAVGVSNDAPGFANGGGTGNPTGFDIQMMKALDKENVRKTAPSILTVANRAASLKNGSAELVIATFSITQARNNDGIDFAGPYIVTPQALLVKAENNAMQDKNDLKGKSVCRVKDTTGNGVSITGANIDTTGATTAQCVNLLERGNTDAVFDDELILHGFADANPGKFKVVLSGAFGNEQFYGVAMLAGHKEDCLKINDIIRTYLRTQWTTDFRAELAGAVNAYPGSFETKFKPNESYMNSIACKL